MDEVVLILLLIPVAILGAFVLLFLATGRLRNRLEAAEERIAALEARLQGQPGALTGSASAPQAAEHAQTPPAPWTEAIPEATPASDLSPPAPPERPEPQPEQATSGALPPPLPVTAPPPAGPSFAGTVFAWLSENWFYAVSALSLALAGTFAAQYAAERGLLSPQARVLLAVAFGAALIGAGEFIRRRWGDAPESATAYLPSVFSGAGLVTLYGAALTAQLLYGLITPGVTLALLVAVAACAVALGWFYGPLIAAIGILGATAAPFLAGGAPGPAWMIQSYFGLVMLSGLMINALKKWRWIDELSLLLPFGAASFAYLATGGTLPYLVQATAFPVIATIFLGGGLQPAFAGPGLLGRAARGQLRGSGTREGMPVLSWGIGALGILVVAEDGEIALRLGLLALTALFALGAYWSRRTAAANDFPPVAALALFILSVSVRPKLFVQEDGMIGIDAASFYWLIGAALGLSLVSAWRSATETGPAALWWAQGAAASGPGLLALQELLHAPGQVIGGFPWAGIAMGFAAIATLLGERARHRDGADRSRTAFAALAAMALIALAMFVLLSKAALSVALAVLILGAVAMDARWKLRQMSWFSQLGISVLVYRALVDPGIAWAWDVASLFDLVLAHGAPAAALAAAGLLIRASDRPVTRAALEGGFAAVLGSGVSVLIARLLRIGTETELTTSDHLQAGLIGAVWLISGWGSLRTGQAQAAHAGDSTAPKAALRAARILRRITAGLSFLAAASALSAAATVLNPLLEPYERVLGPVVLSSLALAYLLPGLLIVTMAVKLRRLARPPRAALGTIGAGFVALYLFLTVAQAWRGNDLAQGTMGEGELWSYTALLLVIGAALLVAALLRRSTWLRYVADGVLVLAIAKVFVLDASGLEGLVRAGSFLILGLALAGLAWINRRAAMAAGAGPS